MIILKRTLISFIVAGSGLAATGGCSSVMTHTGADQGYYSGTRASLNMLRDDDTSWAMAPLVALDLSFSAVMDTLLLPYDYYRADGEKSASSPRERVLQSERRHAAPAPSSPGIGAHPSAARH